MDRARIAVGELWSVKANLTSVKMGNHQREGQTEQHGLSDEHGIWSPIQDGYEQCVCIYDDQVKDTLKTVRWAL